MSGLSSQPVMADGLRQKETATRLRMAVSWLGFKETAARASPALFYNPKRCPGRSSIRPVFGLQLTFHATKPLVLTAASHGAWVRGAENSLRSSCGPPF